jgi:peptide/nickel transport system ATP-binding protein
MALLEVRDLAVGFDTEDGRVRAVDGVSFDVDQGGALGIVGESGSGKSVTALTLLGLTRARNADITGSVAFAGRELLGAPERELRQVRGGEIGIVFQDPLSSLHPLKTVGAQLVEAHRAHRDVSRAAARERAAELLDLVGIRDARRRLDSYPHELSGGMRQRVMIAMAVINEPRLLIADEPTTALDVTVQAALLDLLRRLRRELGMALLLVSHDLAVVAQLCDEIAVMYAGRIVERGPTATLLEEPEHPYTWGLLGSIPRLDRPRARRLQPIPGRPPSAIDRPSGCAFHPRCPYARDEHRRRGPPLVPADPEADQGHQVACLLGRSARRALWAALRDGGDPEEAMRRAGLADAGEGRA